MAKKNIKADFSELKGFVQRLNDAANGDLKKQYNIWLEAIGMGFLGIIQDEIIRLEVEDTRRLLNSFSRGNSDCVFEMDSTGLKLTIGTNVEYAGWVNDGHWTNPPGVAKRWVPGTWQGKTFVYDKNAKTGMLLKQHWIEGYHYFDVSITIFEKILTVSLERNLNEWLNQL